MNTLSLREWNRRQILVFERFSRVHSVPLTLELLCLLAQRFAQKHALQRRTPSACAVLQGGGTSRARKRASPHAPSRQHWN